MDDKRVQTIIGFKWFSKTAGMPDDSPIKATMNDRIVTRVPVTRSDMINSIIYAARALLTQDNKTERMRNDDNR